MVNIIFGECVTLGGGRNRIRRERRSYRHNRRYPCATSIVKPKNIPEAEVTLPCPPPVNYSDSWNEEIARLAFVALAESGKSQKDFAAEHGFSPSRFTTWRKRLQG